MRKKKITFSDEEIDEAEHGYKKEIPEQELPYYQKIIMKELKKKKPITITQLVKKFNLPERSLGNNIDKMLVRRPTPHSIAQKQSISKNINFILT